MSGQQQQQVFKKPPVPTQRNGPGQSTPTRQPFGVNNQANYPQPTGHNSAGKHEDRIQRGQLNQTHGNFVSKMQPNTGTSVAVKHGSLMKAGMARITTGNVVHHQLETEISVIYSLYTKTQDLLAQCKTKQDHARVTSSYDCDKWRKKFFMVFTRERGTLDLTVNPSLTLDLKNITLNPESTTRVGNRILKENVKFWILYIQVIAEKLNDFTKATLRSRLLGTPGDLRGGIFSNSQNDFDLLIQEVGQLIDADKLIQVEPERSEQLPTFGMDPASTHQVQEQVIKLNLEDGEEIKGKENETFSKDANNNGVVVDAPSENYVVYAPVEMSIRQSVKGTPQFLNEEDVEDEPMREVQAFQQQQEQQPVELTNERPDRSFYTCMGDQYDDEETPLLEIVPNSVQQPNVTFDLYTTALGSQLQCEEQVAVVNVFSTEQLQEQQQDEHQSDVQLQDLEMCQEKELHSQVHQEEAPNDEGEVNQTLIIEQQNTQEQVPVEVQEPAEEIDLPPLEDVIPPNDDAIVQELQPEAEMQSDDVKVEEEEVPQAQCEDLHQPASEAPVEQEPEQQVIEPIEEEEKAHSVQKEAAIQIEEEHLPIEIQTELEEISAEHNLGEIPLQEEMVATHEEQESPINEVEVQVQSEERPCDETVIDKEELKDEVHELRKAVEEEKKVNPKKRKRSPSNESTGSMQLRPRNRQRKLNSDAEEESTGSSYIRYEVIEKKGTQYLVPVRYSIRKAGQQELDRQILISDEVEYKPSEIEGLFKLDHSAQEIRKILETRQQQWVQVADIEDILSVADGYALLKVGKAIGKSKYGGHSHVCVPVKTGKAKDDDNIGNIMKKLLLLTGKMWVKQGVMLTHATADAIKYIQTMHKPAQNRVETRRGGAKK